MPLATTGTCRVSASRTAASSAPSAHTSEPSTSTGRLGRAEQRGDLGQVVRVGLTAGPACVGGWARATSVRL